MDFSKIKSATEFPIDGVDPAIAQLLASLGYRTASEAQLSQSAPAATLAVASDYCDMPCDLLEEHRLYFDDPVRGRSAVMSRLEHMVHARRNPEVIEAIMKAASRVGPELGAGFLPDSAAGPRPLRRRLIKSLPALASKLDRLQRVHPAFSDALLAGRLRDAIAIIPPGEPLTIVCEMAALWSLHDLQMMAAKLHRSLWAACDGLLAAPGSKPMTIGSFIQPARDWLRFSGIAHAVVKRGTRPMNASEQRDWNWAAKFVARQDLARDGLEFCRALGLTDAELDGSSGDRGLAVMRSVYERASPIIERYESELKLFETARVTVPGEMAVAKNALERGRAKALQRLREKELARQPLAMAWYGMSPVEAMAYACICFVKRMEWLEKTIERASKTVLSGTAFVAPLDRGRLNNRQRATVNALVKVYRAAILRDPDHLSFKIPKVDDDESADDLPLCIEANGKYWTCEHPLLPHPNRPLENSDIILGRGISLSDKIHDLDVFDKKRLGRPAREAAEALIRRRPIDDRFDLALPARLGDAHS